MVNAALRLKSLLTPALEAMPQFIKTDEWPPQSPHCNPMDYAIWDSLKKKVYLGLGEKMNNQSGIEGQDN